MAADALTVAPGERAWSAAAADDVVDRAEAWLSCDALAAVISALDGPARPREQLAELADWSAAVLDTRTGGERRDAAPTAWSAAWVDALLNAAGPLGLRRTAAPTRDRYDDVIVLGGATTGNVMRVALARQLAGRGVRFGQVVALTADRPIGEHELRSEPDSAQDRSEWRHLRRHIAEAFGPLADVVVEASGDGRGSWRDERSQANGVDVRVLVAPSSEPDTRRANTADAIRFYARRVDAVQRRSALVVTSAIYVPYQFFAAAPRLLGEGVQRVELVGTPTADDGDRRLLAQRVGQEIHAAIMAAVTLVAGAAGP